MLINISNHHTKYWSKEQKQEGKKKFGRIKNIAFPQIPADANEEFVTYLASEYGILIEEKLSENTEKHEKEKNGIHLMGEMTFCYALIDYLGIKEFDFYASTTERNAQYDKDGKKISDFKFVQFRKYTSYYKTVSKELREKAKDK